MPERKPSRLAAVRDATGTLVGSVLGLIPHVLHHVGLVAGTAFLAGAGGNAALYVVGLLLSIPMLRRIHRRFGSWRAPAIAIAVFTAMFLVSALVVGPAISADSAPTDAPSPGPTPTDQHTEHHT